MRIEPFAMERWQSTYENTVEINLSESGVHPLSVRELLGDRPVAELLDARLLYPQTNGSFALRRAIAALHPGAGPEHVLVTNGGSEANFVVCWNLLEPHHEVVVITPIYGQVPGVAAAFSGRVLECPLRLDAASGRYRLDLELLRQQVGPRTRLIALCNPNNPTGARCTAAELDALAALADRHGCHVLCDEIYRGAELDGEESSSLWGRTERAILTGGLSKAYGLPGLRLGWVVAPPALVEELWSHHDYTSIAPSVLSDQLACIALEPTRRADLLRRTRDHLRENLAVVRAWCATLAPRVSLVEPEAGAIAWLRYTGNVGSLQLAERLRAQHSVLVVPGSHFGCEGHLRIGFGDVRERLQLGLERLAQVLREIHA